MNETTKPGLTRGDNFQALLERACACLESGHLDDADEICNQVLRENAEQSEAWHLRGLIARSRGHLFEACDAIMAAIARDPQGLYFFNLGTILLAANRPAASVECFRLALERMPGHIGTYNNLGNALRAQKEYHAAVTALHRAIELAPDHAQAYNNLGNTLMELDELEAALEAYRCAIALRPDLTEPRSNLLFAQNYRGDLSPSAYLDDARAFGTLAAARARPWSDWLVEAGARTERPLRVGIVSGDLRRHPVGYFLESVIASLDPTRVELVAYPTRECNDEVSVRIKTRVAAWTSVNGVDDERAAAMIRADRIDILIDAAGHGLGNRLPLFCWRPAPVQVTWPGYFASTGVGAIDYVLGDKYVLPDAEADHFVEKPWRLPDSYLCFTPPLDRIEPGEAPMFANGHITFGYFGNLTKLNDHVIDVWSNILNAMPDAVLYLKSEPLSLDDVRAKTIERFAARGITAAQLRIEGKSPRADYFSAYHNVDISLSPFPYGAGTTAVESLWMGVPVLCLRGDRFLSRICESMLQTAGLVDWVAADEAEYIAKAIAYASDQKEIARRGERRALLLASPVCDAARFARNLEDAVHGMWERYCAGAGRSST